MYAGYRSSDASEMVNEPLILAQCRKDDSTCCSLSQTTRLDLGLSDLSKMRNDERICLVSSRPVSSYDNPRMADDDDDDGDDSFRTAPKIR